MKDLLLTLSTAQAVTGDAISTNVITGKAASNISCGRQLFLVVRVTTAFTGSDSVVITAEMDSAVGLDATPTVLATSPSIAESALTLGKQFILALSPGWQVATDVYIGCRYNAGSALSTGKFDAWITPDLETNYPLT
jgi:hypothetical protein